MRSTKEIIFGYKEVEKDPVYDKYFRVVDFTPGKSYRAWYFFKGKLTLRWYTDKRPRLRWEW